MQSDVIDAHLTGGGGIQAHVANEAAAQGSKSAKSTKRLASNIYTILVDLKPAKAENGTPSMFTLDDVTVLGPAHPLRYNGFDIMMTHHLTLGLPPASFRQRRPGPGAM